MIRRARVNSGSQSQLYSSIVFHMFDEVSPLLKSIKMVANFCFGHRAGI